MNYRHAYHAGNFADVLKHVVLARVLTYLKLKPAPFRVIDAHAGAGVYDLGGVEAGKTGEWRDGIARVLDATAPQDVAELLAPYIGAIRRLNPSGCLTTYPGSPLLSLELMRASDRLIANELHAIDAAHLQAALRGSANAKTTSMDAYLALRAFLPPVERRGVVLIDPPFEEADEFARLAAGLEDGLAKFATGVFVVWYPLKDRAAADAFRSRATDAAQRKFVDARLAISRPFAGLGLTESAVLVLNPPFTLESDLRRLLPWLSSALAEDEGAGWSLEVGED